MHAFIRELVAERYLSDVAEEVSILYGGSVKPANAQEIFSKEDVDGGLIGGAALNANDFTAIIKAI
jgi:triosephosphate isomerase